MVPKVAPPIRCLYRRSGRSRVSGATRSGRTCSRSAPFRIGTGLSTVLVTTARQSTLILGRSLWRNRMHLGKRIGVLMGGLSSERDLSLLSGEAVFAALEA